MNVDCVLEDALSHGRAVYATYFFLTWLPGYLQAEEGMSVMSSGLFTGIPYLGAAVLGILIGLTGDRVVRGQPVAQGGRRVVVATVLMASSVIFLVPLVSSIWGVLAVTTLSLATCTSAVSLNLSLVNDLVLSEEDVGISAGFITAIGNLFGLLAPIVTGYVVSGSGSFSAAFVVVGVLLVVRAMLPMFGTRRPVGTAEHRSRLAVAQAH